MDRNGIIIVVAVIVVIVVFGVIVIVVFGVIVIVVIVIVIVVIVVSVAIVIVAVVVTVVVSVVIVSFFIITVVVSVVIIDVMFWHSFNTCVLFLQPVSSAEVVGLLTTCGDGPTTPLASPNKKDGLGMSSSSSSVLHRVVDFEAKFSNLPEYRPPPDDGDDDIESSSSPKKRLMPSLPTSPEVSNNSLTIQKSLLLISYPR